MKCNLLKKRWSSLVLIGVSFFILSSCDNFLKGRSTQENTLKVEKASLNCLKTVSNHVQRYLQAQASSEEIEQTLSCVDQALFELQTRAEGQSEADAFSVDDLDQIFSQFLKEEQISRLSIQSVLKFKAALWNGSEVSMSKAEINRLRLFLKTLQVEAIRLNSWMGLFQFQKQDGLSEKSVSEAFTQLQLSLKNILHMTDLASSGYQWSSFKTLLEQLDFLNSSQKELLQQATVVLNLLMDQQIISTKNDLDLVIQQVTEVMRLHAFQVYHYVDFDIQNSTQLNKLVIYIQDWLNLLENSLQYQRTQLISAKTLDPFVHEIFKKGLLPADLQETTAITFYKKVLIRLFQPGLQIDTTDWKGLGPEHFVGLKKEIAIFRIYLRWIDQATLSNDLVMQGVGRYSLKSLQTSMQSYASDRQIDLLDGFSASEQAQILVAFNELRSEFVQQRPVLYRFQKMVIARNQEIWDQNWDDLTRGLLGKILAREWLRGWGDFNKTGQVATSSLSLSQMQVWLSDFKDFGEQVKLFDPRSKNLATVLFSQGDLLTYAADGDNRLEFFEAIQLVNMMLSGSKALDEMQSHLKQIGCNQSERDVFGNFFNNEKCLIQDLKQNYKAYFSNLSYLNVYLSKLTDADFEKFYQSLMELSRVEATQAGIRVDTSDLRAFVTLLYDIESLYATFDVDGNMGFSPAEIRAGYPRFKDFAKDYAYKYEKPQIDLFNSWIGTVAGYSCYAESDLIRESFIFLAYTGRIPEVSDLNAAPCLFGHSLISFSGEVDRKIIINTFKILKDVLGS